MTMTGFSDRDLGVLRKRDALTGVRGWYADAGKLVGVYGKKWEPGPHRAACEVHHHDHTDAEIPFRECWCGFWAGYTTEPLVQFSYGDKPVVGVVRGWGRMVSGDRGFRAERAEISGLHLAYEYVRRGDPDQRIGGDWNNLDFTSTHSVAAESEAKLAEDEAVLSASYPGVPFYPSINAMLEAHPIRRPR